jgi:hypothetical protein
MLNMKLRKHGSERRRPLNTLGMKPKRNARDNRRLMSTLNMKPRKHGSERKPNTRRAICVPQNVSPSVPPSVSQKRYRR